MNDKLHQLSASELVFAYRRQTLSPVDVTRAVLDHIGRRDPELNAFVLLDPDSALRDARESEGRWRSRKPAGRDAALLLTIISEPDERDPFRLPEAAGDFRDALGRSWRGTRIGYSSTLGYASVDPDVLGAFDRAVSVFQALGARVEAADPPFRAPDATLRTLFAARAAFTVRHLDESARRLLDPAVLAAAEEGQKLGALDYLAAEAERVTLAESMADYHRHFDLLLTPTTAELAPRLDAPLDGGRKASPFAFPFSLTRQPAISVPCGTARGLPIGLQIVGRPFEDALVLAAAHAFEQHAFEQHGACPGHRNERACLTSSPSLRSVIEWNEHRHLALGRAARDPGQGSASRCSCGRSPGSPVAVSQRRTRSRC